MLSLRARLGCVFAIVVHVQRYGKPGNMLEAAGALADQCEHGNILEGLERQAQICTGDGSPVLSSSDVL